MGKSLVTKLNGTTSNNALLHIGGLKFKIRNTVGDGANFKINLITGSLVDVYASAPIDINGTKTQNLKSLSVVTIKPEYSSDYTEIEVVGRYSIKDFGYDNNTGLNVDDVIDLSIDKYMNKLSDSWSRWLCGIPTVNLQEVKTNYITRKMSCKNVSGNIGNADMVSLVVDDAKGLYGDISNMINLTGVCTTGDINDEKIYGSINKLTSITSLYSNKSVLTGDLAKLNKLEYISVNNSCAFTYSDKSLGSEVILAGRLYLKSGTDVDNFLLHAAMKDVQSDTVHRRKIDIYTKDGSNRTSASDSAVATLKSKGMTIILNQVAL